MTTADTSRWATEKRKFGEMKQQIMKKFSFCKELKIGRGGSGSYVFIGKMKESFVAVKRIDVNDYKSEKHVFQILKNNVLSKVLSIYNIQTSEDFAYVVTPLMEYNLAEVIENEQLSSSLNKLQLCKDVLMGLTELHRFRIIHRDLKPSNILISKYRNSSV